LLSFLMRWTASSTRPCERPLTTTAAPSCASNEAMAKPIPAVEPVTSAFLFVSCKSIGASLDGATALGFAGGIRLQVSWAGTDLRGARRLRVRLNFLQQIVQVEPP